MPIRSSISAGAFEPDPHALATSHPAPLILIERSDSARPTHATFDHQGRRAHDSVACLLTTGVEITPSLARPHLTALRSKAVAFLRLRKPTSGPHCRESRRSTTAASLPLGEHMNPNAITAATSLSRSNLRRCACRHPAILRFTSRCWRLFRLSLGAHAPIPLGIMSEAEGQVGAETEASDLTGVLLRKRTRIRTISSEMRWVSWIPNT
jgi:hypothetical protein